MREPEETPEQYLERLQNLHDSSVSRDGILSARASMLTRIMEEEHLQLLESYTVHYMQKELPSLSEVELYKMEKVTTQWLRSDEKDLDLMCFPVLFPDAHTGEHEERPIFF